MVFRTGKHTVAAGDELLSKLLGRSWKRLAPAPLCFRQGHVHGCKQVALIHAIGLHVALCSSVRRRIDELSQTMRCQEPSTGTIVARAYVIRICGIHDDAAVLVTWVAPDENPRKSGVIIDGVHFISWRHRLDKVVCCNEHAAVVRRKDFLHGAAKAMPRSRGQGPKQNSDVELARRSSDRAFIGAFVARGQTLGPLQLEIWPRVRLADDAGSGIPMLLDEMRQHRHPKWEVVNTFPPLLLSDVGTHRHRAVLDRLHEVVLAVQHLPRVDGGVEPHAANVLERADDVGLRVLPRSGVRFSIRQNFHEHHRVDCRPIVLIAAPWFVVDAAINKELRLAKDGAPTITRAPWGTILVRCRLRPDFVVQRGIILQLFRHHGSALRDAKQG
mmetsp:Transcript_49964/g.160613  ORF Transcript_49964/g.160613 Transcript_49964/m.160613 type:complete len:386 (+) Transcript_49964:379-1536(+)